MDFSILISELRSSSKLLSTDSDDKSLLSSVYCNNACKALQRVTECDGEYDSIITGLWLIVAHFAEQTVFLRPVPALSELCFKLFRQCAKAVLNIQWQNLDEDSSVRQNFLVSLSTLHDKLLPFDFPRFHLLESLTENPWTNPTLAKIMGGEVESADKDEVRRYIEQEDPIILQLRVDMMLQENCEEYALNLCSSCLMHPELATDLGLRTKQLSLLYKLGHEDKLEEECQRLSIHDALRIIKELNASGKQKELYTVLAQTFMVQNWIRPCDTQTSKELLRMWIRHQLLVDEEHDQFKDSIWAMAKLSHSTEQIVIIINVLREECGDTFLQLYVDMSLFAVKVDKSQMETSIKDGNMDAAAARRADMASVCAKLSCLCHHTSLKVARICALTSFALKPTEESFGKIGVFYGQGGDCCDKCGNETKQEAGTINPATLYELERLLNMLKPEYMNPDNQYLHIHVMCRKFLFESTKNSNITQGLSSQTSAKCLGAISKVEGPGKKKPMVNKTSMVFQALSAQDVQSRQALLNKLRLQNLSQSVGPSQGTNSLPSYQPSILTKAKNKNSSGQSLGARGLQQQMPQSQLPSQVQNTLLYQQQQTCQAPNIKTIQEALRKDPNTLKQLPKHTAQAIVKQLAQHQLHTTSISTTSDYRGDQSLPTVSTLFRPPSSVSSPFQVRQLTSRKYPRPQLYAQPIIVSSTSSSSTSPALAYSNKTQQPCSSQASEITSSVPPPAQLQQAEIFNMTKAQAQGIREFMQSQLLALPAKQQIAVTHQLSGSVVTHNSSSINNSSRATSGRAKTTVELAQHASIAREKRKQQQKQTGQAILMPAGSRQSHIISTIKSDASMPHDGNNQGQQQQSKLLLQPRLSGSHHLNMTSVLNSLDSGLQGNQTLLAQNVTLPSSDELLGSISGIDDTIFNDLLKDSGLLANTFPDIKVDVFGEDKTKKSLMPNTGHSGNVPLKQSLLRVNPGLLHQSDQRSLQVVSSSNASPVPRQAAQASKVSVYPASTQIQQPSRQVLIKSQSPITTLTQPQTSTPATAAQIRLEEIKAQMKQEEIPGEIGMDAANNATYRCIICSLTFQTLDLLREHVRTVCKPGLQSSSVYTTKIEQDKANSALAGVETSTVFQCLRCFELCISQAGIRQHRLTCKRVPTIPSDLKKETNASATSKKPSKSGTTNKQGKAEPSSANSSKGQRRSNNSTPVPHQPKGNSATPPVVTVESGPYMSYGNNQTPPLKSEFQSECQSQVYLNKTNLSEVTVTNLRNVSQCPTSSNAVSPLNKNGPQVCLMSSSLTLPDGLIHHNLNNGIKQEFSGLSLERSPTPSSQNIKIEIHHPYNIGDIVNAETKFLQVKSSNNDLVKKIHKNSNDSHTPRFSEIAGSGGILFYKCNSCSQTLSSAQSFSEHWKVCSQKKKRKVHHEPLTGSTLQNVIGVIEAVAAGNFQKSQVSSSESCEDMQKLRDPVSETSRDTVSSFDGDSQGSQAYSNIRPYSANVTENKMSKQICVDNQIGENISGSNLLERGPLTFGCESKAVSSQGKSLVSAVEEERSSENLNDKTNLETQILPRDRDLLKTIHSIVPETSMMPNKNMKDYGKVVEESTVSESNTSGAESDEEKHFCKVCKETFTTERILLQHYAGKHLQLYTIKSVSNSSSYFCHLCERLFSTFMHYMQHIPNHAIALSQKMKEYEKNFNITQQSPRSMNPRGFSKSKSNLNPKLAQILKKKVASRSAADRIKKQLLRSPSHGVHGKLSKKKRQPMSLTSSEDDYSSDTSNLVFKHEKQGQCEERVVCTSESISKDKIKDGVRNLRKADEAEDDADTEDSQQESSTNTLDEDYVASEDVNSDESISASPPYMRTRKRSSNFQVSNEGKRRRHFSDTEGLYHQDKDASLGFMTDFDTDSNCTTLSVALREDGFCMPVDGDELLIKGLGKEKSAFGQSPNIGALNRFRVTSLTKRQKERLKLCNLNPSVVLDALNLDVTCSTSYHIATKGISLGSDKEEVDLPFRLQNMESPFCDADKKPTFLDSYLSYIRNYSQIEKSSHLFKSKKSQKDQISNTPKNHIQKDQDVQMLPCPMSDSNSSSEKFEAEESKGGTVNVISGSATKFSLRRCSVNLGQKVSVNIVKPLTNEETTQEDNIQQGIPVVCLERSSLAESFISNNAPSKEYEKSGAGLEIVPVTDDAIPSNHELPVAENQVASGSGVPVVCLERSSLAESYISNCTLSREDDKNWASPQSVTMTYSSPSTSCKPTVAGSDFVKIVSEPMVLRNVRQDDECGETESLHKQCLEINQDTLNSDMMNKSVTGCSEVAVCEHTKMEKLKGEPWKHKMNSEKAVKTDEIVEDNLVEAYGNQDDSEDIVLVETCELKNDTDTIVLESSREKPTARGYGSIKYKNDVVSLGSSGDEDSSKQSFEDVIIVGNNGDNGIKNMANESVLKCSDDIEFREDMGKLINESKDGKLPAFSVSSYKQDTETGSSLKDENTRENKTTNFQISRPGQNMYFEEESGKGKEIVDKDIPTPVELKLNKSNKSETGNSATVTKCDSHEEFCNPDGSNPDEYASLHAINVPGDMKENSNGTNVPNNSREEYLREELNLSEKKSSCGPGVGDQSHELSETRREDKSYIICQSAEGSKEAENVNDFKQRLLNNSVKFSIKPDLLCKEPLSCESAADQNKRYVVLEQEHSLGHVIKEKQLSPDCDMCEFGHTPRNEEKIEMVIEESHDAAQTTVETDSEQNFIKCQVQINSQKCDPVMNRCTGSNMNCVEEEKKLKSEQALCGQESKTSEDIHESRNALEKSFTLPLAHERQMWQTEYNAPNIAKEPNTLSLDYAVKQAGEGDCNVNGYRPVNGLPWSGDKDSVLQEQSLKDVKCGGGTEDKTKSQNADIEQTDIQNFFPHQGNQEISMNSTCEENKKDTCNWINKEYEISHITHDLAVVSGKEESYPLGEHETTQRASIAENIGEGIYEADNVLSNQKCLVQESRDHICFEGKTADMSKEVEVKMLKNHSRKFFLESEPVVLPNQSEESHPEKKEPERTVANKALNFLAEKDSPAIIGDRSATTKLKEDSSAPSVEDESVAFSKATAENAVESEVEKTFVSSEITAENIVSSKVTNESIFSSSVPGEHSLLSKVEEKSGTMSSSKVTDQSTALDDSILSSKDDDAERQQMEFLSKNLHASSSKSSTSDEDMGVIKNQHLSVAIFISERLTDPSPGELSKKELNQRQGHSGLGLVDYSCSSGESSNDTERCVNVELDDSVDKVKFFSEDNHKGQCTPYKNQVTSRADQVSSFFKASSSFDRTSEEAENLCSKDFDEKNDATKSLVSCDVDAQQLEITEEFVNSISTENGAAYDSENLESADKCTKTKESLKGSLDSPKSENRNFSTSSIINSAKVSQSLPEDSNKGIGGVIDSSKAENIVYKSKRIVLEADNIQNVTSVSQNLSILTDEEPFFSLTEERLMQQKLSGTLSEEQKKSCISSQEHLEIEPMHGNSVVSYEPSQQKPKKVRGCSHSKQGVCPERLSDSEDADESHELVIETDISSRNLLALPEETESYSQEDDTSHLTDGPKAISALTNEALLDQNVMTPEFSTPISSPMKPLTGAKSLRKAGQIQFVWDGDTDTEDISQNETASSNEVEDCKVGISSVKAKHETASEPNVKKTAVENSELDPLKRKRNALREMTKSATFTWDLDEGGEKSEHAVRSCTQNVDSVTDSVKKFKTNLSQKRPPRKSLNLPDVQRPKSLKVENSAARATLSDRRGAKPSETSVRTSHGLLKIQKEVTNIKEINIQVDDEISFKRDSLPSTPTESPILHTLEINTETVRSRVRRRTGSKVNSHPSSLETLVLPATNVQGSDSAQRKQLSSRSRHNSVESNKSDTATSGNSSGALRSKVGADFSSSAPCDRSLAMKRKGKDSVLLQGPSSKKSKYALSSSASDSMLSNSKIKIDQHGSSSRKSKNVVACSSSDSTVSNSKIKNEKGLTKQSQKLVEKTHSAAPKVSSDPNTPNTRSFKAAIKEYNQKSLRNRGVSSVTSEKQRISLAATQDSRSNIESNELRAKSRLSSVTSSTSKQTTLTPVKQGIKASKCRSAPSALSRKSDKNSIASLKRRISRGDLSTKQPNTSTSKKSSKYSKTSSTHPARSPGNTNVKSKSVAFSSKSLGKVVKRPSGKK